MYAEGIECSVWRDKYSCVPWNERQLAMVHADEIDIEVGDDGGTVSDNTPNWDNVLREGQFDDSIEGLPSEAQIGIHIGDNLGNGVECGVRGASGDVRRGDREIHADELVCRAERSELPDDVDPIRTPSH